MTGITTLHMELQKSACRRAVDELLRKGVDTAWGANGLVGETAIRLLQTEQFLVTRDLMGLRRTPATRDEADRTARFIMAGMCGDWPEKYGWYPSDERAAAVLKAA